jgi:hypothetical protein
METQQNHSERERNRCGVMLDATVPPGNHTFELAEPGKRPLDLPLLFVLTQRPAVLGSRLDPARAVWRTQLNAAPYQLLIKRITVAGAIPNKWSGSSHGDSPIEGSCSFESRRTSPSGYGV